MEVEFKKRGKKFKVNAKECSFFGMFRGLMFRRKESAPALLLFNFKKPVRLKIHSFFVFFKFVAVWLDNKNKIIKMRVISPWKPLIIPEKKFNKLIEIPINKRYEKIISKLNVL